MRSSALKRSRWRKRTVENKDSFNLDTVPNTDGTASMDISQKGQVDFETFVDVCEHIHAALNKTTKWYLISFPIDPESPHKQV